MFTLQVYFTVHFTIRFSSPFAVRWFMVLQILSACPAQGTDLEKNLPGVCPCPCCSFIYNCPYRWVKLEQFLPNNDKLVSCSLLLVLVFRGVGGSESLKRMSKQTRCKGLSWTSLWLTPPLVPLVGCWGLLACRGTADPVPLDEVVPFLAVKLLAWSVAAGDGWSLPVLCREGLSGAVGINWD